MQQCKIDILPNLQPEGIPYETYSDKDKTLVGASLAESEFNPNDPESVIEYSVYDQNGNFLKTVNNFNDFAVTNDTNTSGKGNINTLNLDPAKNLAALGLAFGTFVVAYRFLKNKLGSKYNERIFYIEEISPNRQEVRLNSTDISSEELVLSVNEFSSSLAEGEGFGDFYLNLGDNDLFIANNILVDTGSGTPSFLVHLYEPLPVDVELNTNLYIVTEQADPLNLQVDLPATNQLSSIQPTPPVFLNGPNFDIDIKNTTSSPTNFQSLSELLNVPLTSSYNQLQNVLNQKGITLDLNYTEFGDFTHFSSAKQRLENFYYKVSLIESSSNQINEYYSNVGNPTVSSSRAELENQITQIIANFDGYEKFLYYETSSAAWPKSNNVPPYTLYSTGSEEVLTWFGSDIVSNPYFGGQIESASRFDNENLNSLVKTIPEYLRDDPTNYSYDLFIQMMGQHYDNLYFYTKNITNRFDGDNRLKFGISKDLVGEALKDFGLKLYQNNFTSEDLYTAFLGIDMSGNLLPPTGSELITTYITASDAVIPLNDVNKETYKRLYHNLPYLLKKKGTVEGLRALINCYGIPDTVLRISEFGGKDKINRNDWDYYYRRFSKAVSTSNPKDKAYIKTPWLPLYHNQISGSIWQVPNEVSFRFKTTGIPGPTNLTQSLWLVGTDPHNLDNGKDFNVGLFLYYTGYPGLESGSYPGEKAPDVADFGSLQLIISGAGQYVTSSLVTMPFFDKNWWTVYVTRNYTNITLDNLEQPSSYSIKVSNKIYNGNDGTLLGYPGLDPSLYDFYGSIESIPSNLTESVNRAWATFSGSSYINTSSVGGYPATVVQSGASFGSRFGYSGQYKEANGRKLTLDYCYFSGSIQEIRYRTRLSSRNTTWDFTMNPLSIEGENLTGSLSSFDTLAFRAAAGNELLILDNNISGGLPPNNYQLYTSIHPAVTASSDILITGSFVIANPEDNPLGTYPVNSYYFIRDDQEQSPSENVDDLGDYSDQFEEVYYVDQPAVGIKNRISEKIRSVDQAIVGNILSPYKKIEQNYFASSSYTRDINYLEVAFSPQNEINDDIASTLGYFNIGEFIGDPREISQSLNTYPKLDALRDDYFKKYFSNYNVKDYIRLIKYFDNSLFKMIKDFTPVRTGVATGVVIKQHLLERNRYPIPQPSSSQHYITASIDSAFSSGSYAFSPLAEIEDFVQTNTYTTIGPSGSTSYTDSSQQEFYNGAFSGSNLTLTIGNLSSKNPYLKDRYAEYPYKPYLFSCAGNRHIKETTFLNPYTTASQGEIYLYYITSSTPIPPQQEEGTTDIFTVG